MNHAYMRFLSGARIWFVLGLALGLRTWGQDVAQPPSAGDESPPGAGVLQEPVVLTNGPLQPTVTVECRGRLLVLTYGPASASGGRLSNTGPPGEPPGFTIYKGQRKIAAGQFEYG